MAIRTNIKKNRGLKDFIRLLIGFVCCLLALSIYQQLSLYYSGVIDKVLNRTMLLLVLNHLGFAAALSFVLLLIFRFLEGRKPGLGFKVTLFIFLLFLVFEAILVKDFTEDYSIFHHSRPPEMLIILSTKIILGLGWVFLVIGLLYFVFYKLSSFLNPFIEKMYPFTLFLFLLVLGASLTEKKPINQNKSLNLIVEAATGMVFNLNKYEGVEYPLVHDWESDDTFSNYFKTLDAPPQHSISRD